MPLNNSGPLSFGGSTVGQSINLELGLSATATASINSTAFRTLAGVPSGQISITNFYGKSNSYGWVTYLGITPDNGAAANRSIFVDNNSNLYWIYTSSSEPRAIGRLSSSGVLSTFAQPYADATVNIACTSTRSSSPSIGIVNQNNNAPMLLDSSLSRVFPGTLALGNFSFMDQAITSGGQLVCAGRRTPSKFGAAPTLALVNSAGTSATIWSFPVDSSNPRTLIRTDGTIILVTKSASLIIRTFTSSFTPNNDYYNLSVSGLDTNPQFINCISSSNEIFLCATGLSSAASVLRIDSSYNITHRANLESTPRGNGYQHIATHGGFVYTVSGSSANIFVTCLSASDLSMVFTNNFTFDSGGGSLESRGMYATSEGVFVNIRTSNSQKNIVLKMPLTGMPSSSSVVVSGASATLSWSRPTYTSTPQSVATNSTTTQTPISIATGTVGTASAGSPVTPTATNTIIS